jgi:aldehyde dehydrogenase (NAD+)
MTVLADAAIKLAHTDSFYIGGQWVPPSTDASIEVIDPSTETPVLRVPEAQPADLRAAVSAARHAFDHSSWPFLPPSARAEYLHALASGIRARGEELGRIWSREVGVIFAASRMSSESVARTFEFYANLAEDFPFIERHTPSHGSGSAFLAREPVGVVGAIIPWNASATLMAYKVAPALLAGCTVILKASPEAPGEAYLLAEVAAEVGLPAGVLNVVTANRSVSEQLVTDPNVDKISFTGSTAAGRRIAALCGDRVARCTLELGGKSAAIILDDYDIETAAATLSASACMMTGQYCSSLTRIVVGRDRHDGLVTALSSYLAQVRIGDPFESNTQMGPLATGRQRERVQHYIAKGLEEGADLAFGGEPPTTPAEGFYIKPTLFGNVDNSSTIAREEIFGPVLSVIPADSEQQAVDIANDSQFGLNASVFTRDSDRAYQIARRLRSGSVGHNASRSDWNIVHGGFKASGIGREGGREGLFDMLESKGILVDGEPSSLVPEAD